MDNNSRFFSRLYFENICDQTKKIDKYYTIISEYLKEQKNNSEYSDILSKIMKEIALSVDKTKLNRDRIEELKNDNWLDIILFQVEDCKKLTNNFNGQNIIVINKNNKGNLLRSELVDFYLNNDSLKENCNLFKPNSKMILDIEESIRIVEVAEEQPDMVVKLYKRTACYLAYIQIDFLDNNEVKHIYFCIYFDKKTINDKMVILECIKKFLYNRYDLVSKIEIDFRANIIGEKSRNDWKNNWLSIDKAGSHTDNAQDLLEMDTIGFDYNNIFIPKFSLNAFKDKKIEKDYGTLIKMIANRQISKIFKKIIMTTGNQFETIIDSTDNDKLSETVILFPENKNNKLKYGNVEFHFNSETLNNSLIYKTEEKEIEENVNGMGVYVSQTYKLKYLRAIVVDILNNIMKYSTQAEIYIEESEKEADYLVFKNNVKNGFQYDNYYLKEHLEFDSIYNNQRKAGFSLATSAVFLNNTSNKVQAYYENNYFYVKLPIIRKGKSNGKIIYNN